MSELIVSEKGLDAVIAVSEAQSDMATNSKQFQDNLKLLSDKKTALNKASAALKKQRKDLETDIEAVALATTASHDLEKKVNAAQKRVNAGRADNTKFKAEVAAHEKSIIARENAVIAQESSAALFAKESEAQHKNRSAELTKREVAVTAREERAERIATAMAS